MIKTRASTEPQLLQQVPTDSRTSGWGPLLQLKQYFLKWEDN